MTDPLNAYKEAGRILQNAKTIGVNAIDTGVSHHEVATELEAYIRDEGAAPAFPVNISINHEAAHRTPRTDETTTFNADDVVCLDIGVHVDGYPVDSAVTVDIGPTATAETDAVTAALDAAIDTVEAGVHPSALGSVIHDTLDDHGVSPVTNLMGHGLSRWEAHDTPNIPNTRGSGNGTRELEVGDVIAIEPFATTGTGTVEPTDAVTIFELTNDISVRNKLTRTVLDDIETNYASFPFADRWLTTNNARHGLRRLVRKNAVTAYPVLADERGSTVVQAEHTLRVETDGCTVLTR